MTNFENTKKISSCLGYAFKFQNLVDRLSMIETELKALWLECTRNKSDIEMNKTNNKTAILTLAEDVINLHTDILDSSIDTKHDLQCVEILNDQLL